MRRLRSQTTESAPGIVIAVVDDEPADLLQINTSLLSVQPRARIHGLRSGDALFRYLTKVDGPRQLPKLILLDLTLPGTDGLKILETLQSDPCYKLIPVIMLSGTSDKSKIDAAYRSGARSFLRKPLDPKEFQTTVKGLKLPDIL